MRRHPLFLAYLSLSSVWFFWGTTYVAIRMAIETFPPLLLVGVRFTISGALLLAAARLAGLRLPSRRDVLYSAAFGVLALGVGNACLSYAELWIPSGLAALLVTTSPFWMVGMEALSRNGERLNGSIAVGMLVGLSGTAILVGPDALGAGLSGNLVKGFLVLQAGCLSWSFSSVAQRHRVAHVNAVVNGAIQQLAAGVVALIAALALNLHPTELSGRGIGALVYLMIFGSIVGYTSYVYTLKKLPVAVVTTHVYINPLVAAALGWFIYREPFGWRETLAMAVIFLGVAIVTRYGGRKIPARRCARLAAISTDRP